MLPPMKPIMRWIRTGMAIGLMAAPVQAEVSFLDGVSAESFWFAHLDPAAVRGTPLGQCLDQLAAGAVVRDLQLLIADHLGIRDLKLGPTTWLDAGEPGAHAVMILRGDFSGIAALDAPAARTTHRGRTIAQGPQWRGAPLYLARVSANECVVGTSRHGVERTIDRIDGMGGSWRDVETPPQLPSAALVCGLDMARLGALLEFEAELTRSLQRLWVMAGSHGDDVVFSLSLESGDPARLEEMEGQFRALLPLLAAETLHAGGNELAMPRIEVHRNGRWLKLSLRAPPAQIAALLNGLAAASNTPLPGLPGSED